MAVIGINAPSLSLSSLLTIASLSVSQTPARLPVLLPAAITKPRNGSRS